MPLKVIKLNLKKDFLPVKMKPIWGIYTNSHKVDDSVTRAEKWHSLELNLGVHLVHIYWYKEKLE